MTTIIVIGAVVSIASLARLGAKGVTAFHWLMTESDHEEDERRIFRSAPLPTDPAVNDQRAGSTPGIPTEVRR